MSYYLTEFTEKIINDVNKVIKNIFITKLTKHVFYTIKRKDNAVRELEELYSYDMLPDTNIIKIIKTCDQNEYDPSYIDDDGYTALIWACRNKLFEIADALIETGQSRPEAITVTNNSTYSSSTALIFACYNDMYITHSAKFDYNIVAKLIKTGKSNPDHKDIHGLTALMYLCMKKIEGKTPLGIEQLNNTIVKLIETGKSNMEQISYLNKKTAYDYAIENGNYNIAYYIKNQQAWMRRKYFF